MVGAVGKAAAATALVAALLEGAQAKLLLASSLHTTVLQDGTLFAWGNAEVGVGAEGGLLAGFGSHIGDEPQEMKELPRLKLPAESASTTVLASSHFSGGQTCILDLAAPASRAVSCWGLCTSGTCGMPSDNNVANVPWTEAHTVDLGSSDELITDLQTGIGFGCALFAHGRVKCWGENFYGQLGLGDSEARGDDAGGSDLGDALPFVNLGTDVTVAQLAVGRRHVCVLLGDRRKIKCWGGNRGIPGNTGGALGYGDFESRGDEPGEMGDTLPAFELGDEVLAIEAGGHEHTCVLLASHEVKCWGDNSAGQLGTGDAVSEPIASAALRAVRLGSKPLQIKLGNEHSCAVLEGGLLRCWGRNDMGQLGIGSSMADSSAVVPAALPTVDFGSGEIAELNLGSHHTCVRIVDPPAVRCWGDNENSQLALGSNITKWGTLREHMGDAGLTSIAFAPTAAPTTLLGTTAPSTAGDGDGAGNSTLVLAVAAAGGAVAALALVAFAVRARYRARAQALEQRRLDDGGVGPFKPTADRPAHTRGPFAPRRAPWRSAGGGGGGGGKKLEN